MGGVINRGIGSAFFCFWEFSLRYHIIVIHTLDNFHCAATTTRLNEDGGDGKGQQR